MPTTNETAGLERSPLSRRAHAKAFNLIEPSTSTAAFALAQLPFLAPSSVSSSETHAISRDWWGRSDTDEETGETNPVLTRQLAHLLDQSREETFEDGMSSRFAQEFTAWTLRFEPSALRLLMRKTFLDQFPVEALCEAIRSLSRLDDFRTREDRFQFLVSTLWSDSLQVRDTAAVGLSRLGDPRAASHLRRAIEREANPELRSDLQQVAEDLTI